MKAKELKLISENGRKRLLDIIYKAKAGHTGGDLSVLNLLTVLYFHTLNLNKDNLNDENRDRFILSKGHCVEALYVILEAKGILSGEMLDTLGKFNSPLSGHPTEDIPGIEASTGALGHGLSISCGMAIAAKMDSKEYKTFVVMGDGELEEGSIYEAAMAASHYKLDNLVAIVDRNGLQISGSTEYVIGLESLADRWSAFGWDVIEMNGDDIEDIVKTLDSIDYTNGKPHFIISKTTKGKGVSFMENLAKYHHCVPSEQELNIALEEINQRIKLIENEQ